MIIQLIFVMYGVGTVLMYAVAIGRQNSNYWRTVDLNSSHLICHGKRMREWVGNSKAK